VGIIGRIRDGEYGLLLVLFVFSVFIVAGSYMLYLDYQTYLTDEEMDTWESTNGTVTATEVRTVHISGKGSHYEYYPDIQYSYVVDGEVHYDKRTAPIDGYYETYDGADSCLARYPVGGNITVYYDPDDSSESVLDQDNFDASEVLWAVLPLTIGMLGLMYFLHQFR